MYSCKGVVNASINFKPKVDGWERERLPLLYLYWKLLVLKSVCLFCNFCCLNQTHTDSSSLYEAQWGLEAIAGEERRFQNKTYQRSQRNEEAEGWKDGSAMISIPGGKFVLCLCPGATITKIKTSSVSPYQLIATSLQQLCRTAKWLN